MALSIGTLSYVKRSLQEPVLTLPHRMGQPPATWSPHSGIIIIIIIISIIIIIILLLLLLVLLIGIFSFRSSGAGGRLGVSG